MFQFLGRLAATHPWKIAVAWVAVAILAGLVAPSWDDNTQDDDIRFMPERCSSVRAYHLLEKAFPDEVYACRAVFAVERPDAALTPADFALVHRMVAGLKQLAEAEPDLKIGKISWFEDGVVGRRLTSDDGRCTLIQVSLGTPYLAIQTETTVNRAEARVRELMDQAGLTGLHMHTTGAAGVGRDLVKASADSLERTTIATVILVVLILLVVYRAPLLALVPLATIALSVWVSIRLLALMTLIPGVQLVSISKIFAIVILYGAGTDYCLFLISRYREELEKGEERSNAITRSVRAVGSALAASAGTVVCGLSLMGFAEFAKVKSAGPAIALALAVALTASLTLTPALLKLLGPALFWPRKLRARQPDDAPWQPPVNTLWERISHRVVARPILIWCLAVLMLTPLIWIGIQVSPDYNSSGELTPTSDSIQGLHVIKKHFTAGEIGPVTVLLTASVNWNTPEGKELIGQVSQGLGKLDNVAEVRSLTQPLGKPLPICDKNRRSLLVSLIKTVRPDLSKTIEDSCQKAADYYLAAIPGDNAEQHVARLDVILRSDPFAASSFATLTRMEHWLNEELPHSPAHMGWVVPDFYGVTAQARDMAVISESDRQRVDRLVLSGIFLILVVLLRRIWLAAYLLATVLLSYLATLGATAIMAHLWYGQAINLMDWRVPFFLFTILVAVGEDYNILLVARILQERRRHGTHEGIRKGLARTGGTITTCGLIMAGTFATLVLGGLNTLVQIGFALAFGVLLDAFIVRPFLVPAFLQVVWSRLDRWQVKTRLLPLFRRLARALRA